MTTYSFNSGRKRYSRKGPGFLAAPLFLGIIVALALLWLVTMGLSLGAANAWIMQDTFGEAWNAVWRRWPISMLWGLLFGGSLLRSRRSER